MLRNLASCSTMLLLLMPLVSPATAQKPTCILQAIEKKLDGRARASFMEKCHADVEASCEKSADQRKMEDPARRLFVSNCTAAYVGLK
jgi:hypothetical protein